MRPRRTVSVLAVTALAAATFAVPAQASGEPLDYVAMGDSYSAGSGVLPPDPTASALCLRTTRNYPNVIADATGANLTDVTCGAAQTSHFAESQYPGVDPQFDALSEDTDLITLTIGGNDSGVFIGALLACGSAGLITLGFGSPCKDIYGDRFQDTVRNVTYPDVRDALAGITERAPNARVAILSYPWILPESRGCFHKMPVARGDVPYLRDLQAALNGVIEQAAADTGTTFVDLSAASEGHDACAPLGTRWMEPVLFGTNIVPVHPNALGERKMAEHALAQLGLG